jgi:drug/metabolite transporter (DMT)-like permease
VRLLLAAAGTALVVTPWLTWYTGVEDNGPYSDDGWASFTGVSWLVLAAGLLGLAVAAAPALWRRLPRIVSRLPSLVAAVAAVTVVRHISTGPVDGGPTDPTTVVYAAAALAAAVAVGSFVVAAAARRAPRRRRVATLCRGLSRRPSDPPGSSARSR